jgi:hypothetical protein
MKNFFQNSRIGKMGPDVSHLRPIFSLTPCAESSAMFLPHQKTRNRHAWNRTKRFHPVPGVNPFTGGR